MSPQGRLGGHGCFPFGLRGAVARPVPALLKGGRCGEWGFDEALAFAFWQGDL